MKTRTTIVGMIVGLLLTIPGCVSVKAPERIDIGGSRRPERVDSTRVPNPSTLEEARYELHKAYGNIQWLEDEVAKLQQDKAKYKRQRDDCRDRLKKYEDD